MDGFRLKLRSSESPSRPAQMHECRIENWSQSDQSSVGTLLAPDGGSIELQWTPGDGTTAGQAGQLSLRNRSAEWTVQEVEGPMLSVAAGEDSALLLPDGLGVRVPEPQTMAAREVHYPSGRGTMMWTALATPRGGYYFGRHDAAASPLCWQAEGHGSHTRWTLRQSPWVRPGAAWESSPIAIEVYAGPWQEAARRYRRWADSWCSRDALPHWPNEQSGWMLAILKQQNGAIYWNYHDLSRVWRIALDHGLSAVGLFGWAHGGHDRLYPEYHPDPAMGGEAVLRAALAEARELGLRTILYANGQLIDTATEFYRWQGNAACAWGPNHEPFTTSIRKFNSCTPVTFTLGCHGAPVWQAQMRKLAHAAEDLGADGILYDQIGVTSGAPCHHPEHAHATPESARAEERVAFYRQLAGEMRTINPDFILSTEGIFDALIPAMGWFHGWGTGFAPKPIYEFIGDGRHDFPALFRATFPEVPLIQRFSTPALDPAQANHALLYGLSHEIEARWPADLRYLENGEAPADDAYADCTYYPPDLGLMQRVSSADCRHYLQALCAFTATHADLLHHGQFIGDEGVEGVASLPATARVVRDLGGIVVVNDSKAATSLCPRLRGQPPEAAFEPGKGAVPTDAPLEPNTARLYRYRLAS